jgi:acyl carrier protein
VPGELHIGGAGLARGYLNRPQLTKEKFIPNPFATGRLYKTGDLCRYLPDGNIEFLGRIDHQVKIRGFRIELGEIEAVLSQHKSVREVVVVVVDSGTGKRLVAYVVTEEAISSGTLRAYVGQKLPDYMIPSAFVQLEAMPLTPNGKINRLALPAPVGAVREAHLLVSPSTPTEELLIEIWQEVLGIEPAGPQRISIHDNFFELGGHSLLATLVVSRCRRIFQVELPLHSFFEQPTVAGFAARLEKFKVTQAIQLAVQTGIAAREEIAI